MLYSLINIDHDKGPSKIASQHFLLQTRSVIYFTSPPPLPPNYNNKYFGVLTMVCQIIPPGGHIVYRRTVKQTEQHVDK